jgi:hypothetical protein
MSFAPANIASARGLANEIGCYFDSTVLPAFVIEAIMDLSVQEHCAAGADFFEA